jgi:hypothetical protein
MLLVMNDERRRWSESWKDLKQGHWRAWGRSAGPRHRQKQDFDFLLFNTTIDSPNINVLGRADTQLILSISAKPPTAKMPEKILDDISHRRYNPLRGSWLLVSPHRTKRPWQ